ncbi:gfo/Idh/MocA family oxidoreductase, partial [Candidatus Sumerlaeota bacterium]|nr:gfo/Idh/MocA family oxidoreductase [Candidatus Sumerlaeota bacterium]
DMGKPKDEPPPEGLNYDLWLGPASLRPYNPRHSDFYFYYFWDYSGGMLAAWGVHLFDVVTWAMGPTVRSVTTVGGKLVFDDAREMPDTAGILFECPGYVHTYELRHGNGKDPWGGMDHGLEFYGTQAAIWINRSGYTLFPENDPKAAKFVKDAGLDEPHKRNWLECIRSRKLPNCDVELGHLSSILGHLGNISYRVGRPVKWDGESEDIANDQEAQALLGRKYREPYVLPKV